MKILRAIINKVVYWNLTHNFIFNNLLIWLNLESKAKSSFNPYVRFKPDTNKTTQENAGYSNREEINEVISKSINDLLTTLSQHINKGDRVLDLGCGPGLYLEQVSKLYNVDGTDINASMIEQAAKLSPSSEFYCGNFLEVDIRKKYKFIYCTGVLIYIGRSELKIFFQKIWDLLEEGGVLYLNYPHALSLCDVLHCDVTYIQYSPAIIEKEVKGKFEIISHHHAFDGRVIRSYDKTPYKSTNPITHRTYKNSYLLTAKKIT